MGKVTEYLKSIDILGVQPQLTIHQKNKFKSYCGSIVTLGLAGLMIWAIAIFSRDIVQKQNPNVVISNTNDPDQYFNLGPNTFNLGFAMGNPFTTSISIDLSLFSLFATLFLPPKVSNDGQVVRNATTYPLNVELCNENSFDGAFTIPGYCLASEQPNIPQDFSISTIDEAVVMVSLLKCNALSPIPC